MSLTDSVVKNAGYELVDVEWVSHQRVLRVFIDSTAKINFDDCACVSGKLDELVDFEEFVKGRFSLEVSSPGVDRPLRKTEDFQSFVGEVAQVVLWEKRDKRSRGKGKIVSMSGEGNVSLETQEGPWSFSVSDIKRAHLVYNWQTNGVVP